MEKAFRKTSLHDMVTTVAALGAKYVEKEGLA